MAAAGRARGYLVRGRGCMDQNLCCLQEKFIKDLFVSEGLGAVIDEASYVYARCSL